MGIKGLNRIIKKIAPSAIQEIPIGNYVGTKIAIDSSILLYKYRYCSQGPQGENSHVFGFFQRACYYLRRGILPIFVFDGTPPTEKQYVIEKRSNHKLRIQEKINELQSLRSYSTAPLVPSEPLEQMSIDEKIEKLGKQIIYVTRQHKNECRYLLRLLGIPVLDANGEAEATCASTTP
jgi:flap endonuclease-1